MNYKDLYIGRMLNATSQWFNALIGGNPDVSISARIGYNSEHNFNFLWMLCEGFVDFTFFPIDGDYHCYKAYKRDIDEDYDSNLFKGVGIILMTIIMVVACSVLIPFTWGYYGLKILVK